MTPIRGGFRSENYQSEKEWATAEDGTKIPISIVYRKGLAKLNGTDPLLLDAYGSYGICNDPRYCLLSKNSIYSRLLISGTVLVPKKTSNLERRSAIQVYLIVRALFGEFNIIPLKKPSRL